LAASEESLSRELAALEGVSREALEAARAELRALEGRLRSLREEIGRLEERRRAADQFLKLSAERESLASRFAELLGRPWSADARSEIEERLKLCERARELMGAQEERERIARELEEARSDLAAATGELEELRRKKTVFEGEARKKLDALGSRERALREVKGKFTGLDPARVGALEERVRALSAEIERMPRDEPLPFPAEILPAVEGILREGTALVPRLDECSKRVAELEREIAAAREELSLLGRELAEEERKHRDLERSVSEREGEFERLRRELAAAELAQGLSEGVPCPVCGSPHHPAPAAFPEGVDLGALEAELGELRKKLREVREFISAKRTERTLAERTLAERERKLAELRESRASLEEELSRLRAQLPEGLRFIPWEELGERIRAWRAYLERERVARERDEARAELGRLDGIWREIVEGLGEIYRPLTRGALEEWKAKVEGELRRIEEERRRVERNLDGFRERERTLAVAVSEVSGRVAELERNLEAAERKVELLSREIGIPPEEAAALALTASQRELLEEGLELAREIAAKTEAMASLGIADAEDAEGIRKTYARKQEELGEIQRRLGEVRERIRSLEERLVRKEKLEDERAKVREELKLQRELEGLLRGKAFLEYLVGSQFERILARASHYTAQLSQGRYVLSGEGTDLAVIDYRNGGVARAPHTLSGGETFLVSLSLALALSEAIQLGRRGGAPPIEFFFIDEGFGSLDEESVRMVLELLYRLVDEGLRVGIITHVEVLRRGVPYKLLVHPPDEERGSRVELVIGE